MFFSLLLLALSLRLQQQEARYSGPSICERDNNSRFVVLHFGFELNWPCPEKIWQLDKLGMFSYFIIFLSEKCIIYEGIIGCHCIVMICMACSDANVHVHEEARSGPRERERLFRSLFLSFIDFLLLLLEFALQNVYGRETLTLFLAHKLFHFWVECTINNVTLVLDFVREESRLLNYSKTDTFSTHFVYVYLSLAMSIEMKNVSNWIKYCQRCTEDFLLLPLVHSLTNFLIVFCERNYTH